MAEDFDKGSSREQAPRRQKKVDTRSGLGALIRDKLRVRFGEVLASTFLDDPDEQVQARSGNEGRAGRVRLIP